MINWPCRGCPSLSILSALILCFGSISCLSASESMATPATAGADVDDSSAIHIEAFNIAPEETDLGKTLTVDLVGENVEWLNGATLEFRWKTEVVSLASFELTGDQGLQAKLLIPFDVPAGTYQLVVVPEAGEQLTGASAMSVNIHAEISLSKTVPAPAITGVSVLSNGELLIDLNGPAQADTIIGVWYKDARDYLMAVCDVVVPEGRDSVQFPLESERWRQAIEGPLKVFVYGATVEPVSVNWKNAGSQDESFKPMGHGVYRYGDEWAHQWYVNDDHALVWDGRPWVPFGGAYNEKYMTFFPKDTKERQEVWRESMEILDQLQESGISDMYLSLTHGSPLWARQAFVDELNRRGIRFGLQVRDVPQRTEVYPIRSTEAQGLITGLAKEPGQLTVELSKKKISQLLLIDKSDPSKVTTIGLDFDFDQGIAPEFIVMIEETNKKKDAVGVTIDVPGLEKGAYYVLPRVLHKGHIVDVWAQREGILGQHSWIKSINWGENFRFIVDTTRNESGVYNGDESVRVWSDAFNSEYEDWLKDRYGDIERLKAAWHLTDPIDGFAQASRLVPVRDKDAGSESIWWVDPTTQEVFLTQEGLGEGWIDFTEAVRVTYGRNRDRIASEMRKWFDVPIVLKHVCPWTGDEFVNHEVGGITGIGLDTYPVDGSKVTPGMAPAAAEVLLSAQTVWFIGTELGYHPSRNNGGVHGLPSEEYMLEFVRIGAAWGMKGFFFFGLRLQPEGLWQHHQLYTVPGQLQWLKNAEESIEQDPPQPVTLVHSYPEGQNWWWKSGGELLSRYSCVYDVAPSAMNQSVTLIEQSSEEHNLVAVNALQPLPEAEMMLVNFTDAASVERYGPYVEEQIKVGIPVIYVGLWPAGAELPGLSEHFNEEGTSLRELPEDEVLDSSWGKIKAKRHGNVLIFAEEFPTLSPNHIRTIPGLKPAWIKSMLSH